MPEEISRRRDSPFFILGAPRSGTTLLRDLLRLHSRLDCPEETHFFRWAEAFGSDRYRRNYQGSKLFKRHRELDGVEDFDFFYTLKYSTTRRWLADWYGSQALVRSGKDSGRWFDKTPQNVYGILLLAEAYPEAPFLHIHRHPLNVVASLKIGKVMPKQSVNAAVNTWLEPMMILRQFRRLDAHRLHDIGYEELVVTPRPVMERVFDFVQESHADIPWRRIKTHPEQNRYREVLDNEETEMVLRMTDGYRQELGYD